MSRFIYSILILLLSFSFYSQEKINQTDSKGKKQGVWIKNYEGTNKKRYKGEFKDDIPVGKFYYYYDTGEIAAVSVFEEEGKVTYTRTYYTNGNLMATGKYINQVKDSVWWFFTEDKKMLSRENYKLGKLEGERYVYFPTDPETEKSIIREITTYKNGLKNGQWKQYYKNGKVEAEGVYKDGNFDGFVKWYYENGVLQTQGFYRHAVKNGYWKSFESDGTLKSKVYYLNGKELKGEALEKHLEKIRQEKQH
ncbi:MAG: hypothetical protein R3255_10620 [Candidatus Lokiarchaeia archaeon]|nr:hypothetical protein [Candidatus Lokiarchaeia archaeon]